VGLITFKDCERAMAEALGIPARRTGHFWGMRGSNALKDCDVLLVVGTPTLRPEDVARLARAYYHADPQVIDEKSTRGADGRWHYRDPRMRAEWPMRSRGPSSRSAPIATGPCGTTGAWS
jgi:hypothetical protein